MRRQHPLSETLAQPILERYFALAGLAKQLGTVNTADILDILAPEAGNVDSVIAFALETNSNPRAAIAAAADWADLFRYSGQGSEHLVHRALEVARTLGDSESIGICSYALGILANTSRGPESLSLFREAETHFRLSGNLAKQLLAARAAITWEQPEDGVLVVGERIVLQAEQLNNPTLLGMSLLSLGLRYKDLGMTPRALQLFARVPFVCPDQVSVVAIGTLFLTEHALESCRYEAVDKLRDMLPLLRRSCSKVYLCQCELMVGDILQEQGDFVGASERFRSCLDAARSSSHTMLESRAYSHLARSFMALGNMEDANEALQTATGLPDSGWTGPRVESLCGRGEWAALIGDSAA